MKYVELPLDRVTSFVDTSDAFVFDHAVETFRGRPVRHVVNAEVSSQGVRIVRNAVYYRLALALRQPSIRACVPDHQRGLLGSVVRDISTSEIEELPSPELPDVQPHVFFFHDPITWAAETAFRRDVVDALFNAEASPVLAQSDPIVSSLTVNWSKRFIRFSADTPGPRDFEWAEALYRACADFSASYLPIWTYQGRPWSFYREEAEPTTGER